jgi:hypothetical protein
MRSPWSSTRTITKLPAFRFRAMYGARTTSLVMVGARTDVWMMGYMRRLL